MTANKQASSVNQEIRQLLYVLFGGMLTACLLVATFIYAQEGPRTYLTKNLLIQPKISSTDGDVYSLEKMTFSFFDEADKRYKKVTLSEDDYVKFYSLIKSDKSLAEPTSLVTLPFEQGKIATLNIWIDIKPKGRAKSKMLQEAQFAPGSSYYRLAINSDEAIERWAYFEHNGVFDLAMRLLGDNR